MFVFSFAVWKIRVKYTEYTYNVLLLFNAIQ